MAEQASLSVIIPAYNAQAYLDDCLKSVMTQRGASFEVILVNDGSTDETSKICKTWADTYGNLIYIEQENQGQGGARNVAVTHASGEWLVFLDADDELREGALECLEKSAVSGYDIICYGCVFVARDQESAFTHLPPCTEEKTELMQETLSVLWDKMVRRELWQKERIELSNQYGEDICPVYLMLEKARKIRTLQYPLMYHYDRADNLSSKPDRILQIAESVSHTLETFKKRELLEKNQESLFFMLEKQHRHYKELWKMNHLKEELETVEKLEEVCGQYFPDEYQRVFHVGEETLILIGNFSIPFPGVLENWKIYHYNCLEKYLASEIKPEDPICHFVINVENEVKSVIRQIRTEKWALAYWKIQCLELMEIKEKEKLKGKILLYSDRRQREKKADELTGCFEKAAQALWDCTKIKRLTDFWRIAIKQDRENKADIEEKEMVWETYGKPIENTKLNYRWEYMRLNENVNVLCPWLQLKQEGRQLERYFMEHGYQSMAIYGKGYLGNMLVRELQDSQVKISYVMDCNKKQESEYPLYSLDDHLPETDVIVVSVVHLYEQVRGWLRYKCICPIVSLQDVVDWCRNKCGKE